jgi:hypothetical protein
MLLRLDDYRKPEISRPGGCWDAYIRMRGLREFYEQVRAKIAAASEPSDLTATRNSKCVIQTPMYWSRRDYRLKAPARFSPSWRETLP